MNPFDNGDMHFHTQARLLQNACYITGIDTHIKILHRKCDASTHAEKIAVANTGRRDFPLPVKLSYMKCEGLDTAFWFDRFGGAHFAYSGIAEPYSADIRDGKLRRAFELAEKMLQNMENAVDSCGDY